LKAWDRRAAVRADKYLACSTVIRDSIARQYGIEAEVLSPPPAMWPAGVERPIDGIEPGFLLCVARLLPYKNVDVVMQAADRLGGPDLVVVGDGPERARLTELAGRLGGARIHILGRVDDEQLRWLYREASALLAASYEDFGLSPLEANAFGRPAVALRAGGFLDSVREAVTGTYFDTLDESDIAEAISRTLSQDWDPAKLKSHAESYGIDRFQRRLQDVVAEQLEMV
jgi:glycosyltransferase involved in cell wall biosynthesis